MINDGLRNLTVNINLVDQGEMEALTAEITEIVEKYGFALHYTDGNYEVDELTFLPEEALNGPFR